MTFGECVLALAFVGLAGCLSAWAIWIKRGVVG